MGHHVTAQARRAAVQTESGDWVRSGVLPQKRKIAPQGTRLAGVLARGYPIVFHCEVSGSRACLAIGLLLGTVGRARRLYSLGGVGPSVWLAVARVGQLLSNGIPLGSFWLPPAPKSLGPSYDSPRSALLEGLRPRSSLLPRARACLLNLWPTGRKVASVARATFIFWWARFCSRVAAHSLGGKLA